MTPALEPILGAALLLGFFGSAHCLGMCGGIAAALGQALAPDSAGARWRRASVYSLGRIASYSIAGAAIGSFGGAFAAWTGLEPLLRTLAGLAIVAFGLHVAGWWNALSVVERLGLSGWRRLAPLARRIGRPDRVWKTFVLGMLWGWLPCGLVYAALITAAATGNAVAGALFMLCFGLGTLPALLAASGFGAQLRDLLALRSARRAAGIALLVFGLWSVAGALMPAHDLGVHAAHAVSAGPHRHP